MFQLVKSRNNLFFLILALGLLLLALAANLNKASLLFINAADFAIYQKALLDIAAGVSSNPYVPITDLKILNDHFDPAIYIGAFFAWLFDFRLYGFIVFEWLWFVASVAFIAKVSETRTQAAWGIFLTVFSRGLLEGIEFPIHPTTWSMLPAMVFIYLLNKKQYTSAFITAIALSTFREIYFFMFMGLAGLFILRRNWKQAALYFCLSSVLIIILVYLRPLMLGATAKYSSAAGPLDFASILRKFIDFKYPWKVFAPYFLATGLLIYSLKKKFIDSATALAIAFIIPGVLIHIITGRMVHHHAVPFVAPLIIAIHQDKFYELLNNKWAKSFFVIFTVSMASSRYTRMAKNVFVSDRYFKIDTHKKRQAIIELDMFIEKIPSGSVVISSAGITPYIQTANERYFNYSNMTPLIEGFDYLLLEKPGTGESMPLNDKDIDKILIKCRSQNDISVALENDFFIVFEGAIGQSCLMLDQFWPRGSNLVIPVQ